MYYILTEKDLEQLKKVFGNENMPVLSEEARKFLTEKFIKAIKQLEEIEAE